MYANNSSTKKSQASNDKKKKTYSALGDVETPNKSTFEFGALVIKSNDKLSSQKTAANHSNIKQRNPS